LLTADGRVGRPAAPSVSAAPTGQASASTPKLPPGEAGADQRLDTSPRHGEWVKVDAGGTPVNTWVVYPERSTKAPVVVVIHEIFGETDWIRAVADSSRPRGSSRSHPTCSRGTDRTAAGPRRIRAATR